MTKGRELWNEIMTEGHGNEAAMWLNFYHFERLEIVLKLWKDVSLSIKKQKIMMTPNVL